MTTQNALNNQTVDADFSVNGNTAGGRSLTVRNSNAAATAQANVITTVEPTAFAAFDNWNVSGSATKNWSAGILQSDGAWYLHSGASAFPGNAVMKSTIAGEITMPKQPAFLASLTVATGGVTGAGGVYTLGNNGGGTTTVITDQGSDTSFPGGNLTFTAPVAGFYKFGWQITLTGITVLMTASGSSITVTAGPINGMVGNPGTMASAATNLSGNQEIAITLAAGNTVTFSYQITGGVGDTASVVAANTLTTAWGYLVC